MYLSTALILLFTILDVLIYYLQKQHEENNSSLSDQQSRQVDNHGEKKGPSTSTSSSPDNRCRQFTLAEMKAATNDFDDAFVIGKGGFGKVYKGKIDFVETTDVAIKRLNLDSN
ncbi:putative non-specific serine/threonine protein kinase [Helianthus annuus]|nr:putative non-specific serine/threonine protein kinase [Helianthus annuus]